MYASFVIVLKPNIRGKKPRQNPTGRNITTNVLKPLYEGKLVVKDAKYKDLLHLNQYFLMKAESHKYYENPKTSENIESSED